MVSGANERGDEGGVVRERDCEIFFCQKKRSKKADLLPYYIDCSVFGVCVCVCFHLVFTERVTEENVNKRR